MAAWYNEIEPFAAEWLRRLIAAGHIAPGEVDTRDIRDVSPDDLRGFTQCHFFAGIGVWSHALRLAGWPDDRPVWTGSCPCQPFSAAGRRGGTADERHLWPHWHHLVRECGPRVVFGEQVASKDGLGWFDLVSSDLEATGYAVAGLDLCAAGVGAPHIRQRLYFVGERLADAYGVGLRGGRASKEGARPEPIERFGGLRDVGRLEYTELPPRTRFRPHRGESVREQKTVRSTRGSMVDRLGRDSDDAGLFQGPNTGGMEHAPSDGRVERRAEPGGGRPAGGRGDGWLADADRAGQPASGGGGQGRSSPEAGDDYRRGSTTSRMGYASVEFRERHSRELFGTKAQEHGERVSVYGTQFERLEHASAGLAERQPDARPVDDIWRDADWLYCRDGKWRPVEPGTFPLAHGAPARVGRLRAYGNAIVAPLAAQFITACMEALHGHE